MFTQLLFSKIVPNCKKLGLLEPNDQWLRRRFEEIGVIQFEDWIDTGEEVDQFALGNDRRGADRRRHHPALTSARTGRFDRRAARRCLRPLVGCRDGSGLRSRPARAPRPPAEVAGARRRSSPS